MGVKRDHDSMEGSAENTNFTQEEADLYDRQIRLWGVNCQKRLRNAEILIIGLNGLGIEVVKNLTLSGVKSITIMDETPVSSLDYSAQYYVVGSEPGLTRSEASKASIQELNPNVSIIIDKEPLEAKECNFFSKFLIVFATGIAPADLVKINNYCHQQDVLFYCGETWGFYGYGFVDLLKHEFSKKVKKGDEKDIVEETVLKTFEYCTLETALKLNCDSGLNKRTSNIFFLLHIIKHFYEKNNRLPSPLSRDVDIGLLQKSRDAILENLNCDQEKIPDSILENVFGEISPVCAAVGGIVANDIIKAISKQGEPLCNFLFFDGEECTGAVQHIITKNEDC